MRRYDLASTLFLMVLAAYVTVSGFQLGFGEWREPGPGFLAVLSGLALGTLAACWFGTGHRDRDHEGEPAGRRDRDRRRHDHGQPRDPGALTPPFGAGS